jgi:anti-sigma regulatory factor (Ser/Thr protein kinase)
MRKNFKRALSALEEVFLFLDDFAANNDLDPATILNIRLVVEEMFTNIIKYSTSSQKKITIDISLTGQVLQLQLIDKDGQPFDPTRSGEYNSKQTLEERPIGKVGLHLVKNLTDDISYEHKNGQTILTIKKLLKG